MSEKAQQLIHSARQSQPIAMLHNNPSHTNNQIQDYCSAGYLRVLVSKSYISFKR